MSEVTNTVVTTSDCTFYDYPGYYPSCWPYVVVSPQAVMGSTPPASDKPAHEWQHCPLCGKRVESKESLVEFDKKISAKKTKTLYNYTCGTQVLLKDGERSKTVVGNECIDFSGLEFELQLA